jgi:uncharacterized protein (TIGR02246 family)
MNRSARLTGLAWVGAVALAAACAGGGDADAARRAIAAVNAEFVAAVALGDGPALGRLYSPDGDLLPPDSESVHGQVEIGAFWQKALDSGVKTAALETVEIEVRGDLAFETGRYSMNGADGVLIDNGKYVVVWRRVGSTWSLYRDIWNTSRPPTPAG